MKHRLLEDSVLLRTEQDCVYKLQLSGLKNSYYILTDEHTRHLMSSPEVVGYDAYEAMVPSTLRGMQYLTSNGTSSNVDILTILRGGLNYPLEECAYRAGLRVQNIDFVSCERIIKDDVIKGLDVRYMKLSSHEDTTLLIGDIIASGATLKMCLNFIVDWLRFRGGSIRRIVFFTIGGSRAIDLMEDLTPRLRETFPEFEGFTCFFYEGIFKVYETPGVLGFQVPDIDFYWGSGVIAPEFRSYVMTHDHSLLEKCIIYDGGARRYEIPEHYKEVVTYWDEVIEAADEDRVEMMDLVHERLGYETPISYREWLRATHFSRLGDMHELYESEMTFVQEIQTHTLKNIALERLEHFTKNMKGYEQD